MTTSEKNLTRMDQLKLRRLRDEIDKFANRINDQVAAAVDEAIKRGAGYQAIADALMVSRSNVGELKGGGRDMLPWPCISREEWDDYGEFDAGHPEPGGAS